VILEKNPPLEAPASGLSSFPGQRGLTIGQFAETFGGPEACEVTPHSPHFPPFELLFRPPIEIGRMTAPIGTGYFGSLVAGGLHSQEGIHGEMSEGGIGGHLPPLPPPQVLVALDPQVALGLKAGTVSHRAGGGGAAAPPPQPQLLPPEGLAERGGIFGHSTSFGRVPYPQQSFK